MNNQENNKDIRKVSDILLSLEQQIILLIKMISNNDMNNKLVLDRLNKLISLNDSNVSGGSKSNGSMEVEKSPILPSVEPSIEINKEPIKSRKRNITQIKNSEDNVSYEQTANHMEKEKSSKTGKIPVGQRVTDHNGKDLFMADVLITNINTGDTHKCKTNAVGKWQAYLEVGKYYVAISKIIDPNTLNKIESLQEIEIKPEMKSLQLPIIFIKR